MARTMGSIIFFLATLLCLVSAWDIGKLKDRTECQAFGKKNALDGCDQHRTVVVDAAGSKSDFKTVQSGKKLNRAAWSLLTRLSCGFIAKQYRYVIVLWRGFPLLTFVDTYIILVTAGNYTEQVGIPSQAKFSSRNLQTIGQRNPPRPNLPPRPNRPPHEPNL